MIVSRVSGSRRILIDTINAYAVYAWRPNIDLSMRYTYGSGFPIPGFITEVGNQ